MKVGILRGSTSRMRGRRVAMVASNAADRVCRPVARLRTENDQRYSCATADRDCTHVGTGCSVSAWAAQSQDVHLPVLSANQVRAYQRFR